MQLKYDLETNSYPLYKYPRTMHLPWSLGATHDDRILANVDHFEGKMVYVTEKMDGENTTMMREDIHARSLDSKDHVSRHWAKHFWSKIRHDIPADMRICGENLYAQHSIAYDNLESYFQVFNIWYKNDCLNLYDTFEWCQMLGLAHVKILYRGTFDAKLYQEKDFVPEGAEGYVVRMVDTFKFQNFDKNVAKFVRANHVTTDQHWMHKTVVPNKLKG
jgi:hypothetical protein